MNMLFLTVSIVSIVALTAQGTLIKLFGDKRPGAEITYTLVSAVCAFFMFGAIALFSASQFNPMSIPYSLFFAICYAGSTITYVLAVGCGSLAITTTIHSFALVIPTVLGFLIWDEPINGMKVAGFVLFVASLALVGEKGDGNNKLSGKWLVLMCISFFCEGLAPVAIKMHAKALGEQTASECNDVFMVIAYAMAVLGIFVAAVLKEGRMRIPSSENGGKSVNFMLDSLKIALPLASLGGVFNGLYNFMNTVVANNGLNISVFYPVVSAGQLIFTCIVAVVFFREKMSKKQYAAISCGIVAIVLLNL